MAQFNAGSVRVLSLAITGFFLAACGGGDGGGDSKRSFALSGNLQTFQGVHGTTSVTSTTGQPLTVTGDNVSWQASSTVPWVQLQATSGTGGATVPFTVNTSSLPTGVSEGTIRVTDTNSNVTLSATVSITMRALNFVVSPTELTFNADANSSIEPLAFTVSDELNGQSGSGGYAWQVNNPSAGISLTPTSGNTSATTTVSVNPAGLLNASLGAERTVTLQVTGNGPGSPNGSQSQSVALRGQVHLPRAHAVFPNIVEPGPTVVTLVGVNFQTDDAARLRVNGAAPVSVTRVSEREMQVDLGVLTDGRYAFTFANGLGLARSVADLVVEPRGAFGAGEIPSTYARQNLMFDSHRGVLYGSNMMAGALERYRWDGTSWQALPAIAIANIRDFDFTSSADRLVAVNAPGVILIDDITATSPTVTTDYPSLRCVGVNNATSIAAPATGTVHVPITPCRISDGGGTADTITYDLLFRGVLLTPRDPQFNTDVDWMRAHGVLVSGDRRYVATPTRVWDSQTGQFVYQGAANNWPLASIDKHATKQLFMISSNVGLGSGFVFDVATARTTCAIPSASAGVLSADGSRVYLYQYSSGAPGEIKILSTAPNGPPSAPLECAVAAAPIPVPTNIENNLPGPDFTVYGQIARFSMAVSDDDSILFLSGPAKIMAIALP